MGTYAQNTDVGARLPTRLLNGGTHPSTGDVDAWIAQAEGELEAELLVQKITVPVSDSRGVLLLRAKVVAYCVARWKDGIATGTTMEDRDAGALERKEYDEFIELVRSQPGRAASMLGQSAGDVGGATAVRAYQTDNTDGLSIDNGDFKPTVKRGQSW